MIRIERRVKGGTFLFMGKPLDSTETENLIHFLISMCERCEKSGSRGKEFSWQKQHIAARLLLSAFRADQCFRTSFDHLGRYIYAVMLWDYWRNRESCSNSKPIAMWLHVDASTLLPTPYSPSSRPFGMHFNELWLFLESTG